MTRLRTGMTGFVAILAAVALAACGSSSKKTTTTASTTPTTSTSGGAAPASGPGAGKPAVTIGDKNFTEEYILGSLYQEALAAKGYKVTLKGNIGSTEIIYKALRSGQIQMYPEYTGTLLTAVAGVTAPPKSAQQAYNQAKAYVQKQGFTLTQQTPFFDSDAVGTPKAFAAKHHLTTIADLKQLGSSLKLGADPPFQTRAQGLPGLKKAF